LGNIPAFRNKKSLLFSYNPTHTLAHLFIQALGGSNPLPREEEVLRNLLSTAHDYIESLKSKTKANLTDSIDSYVKESRAKGISPSETEIRSRINEALTSAGKHMKVISEAETTKTRNMGKLMNIARVGASIGQADPNVFFVVVRDQKTCNECIRLHMLADNITPKVWKMSELKYSYHKKGEDQPSVAGLHPHCRCSLTLLAKGFGFKNGKVAFIAENHDEYENQKGKS
jgi:ElaB/YqjD/DUF883 family membrane-anchored ribosome-binding protein